MPENIEYRDTGCDLNPTCLTCPLAVCRYDADPVAAASERATAVRDLRDRGVRPDDIGAMLGISRRTVFRDLRGVS